MDLVGAYDSSSDDADESQQQQQQQEQQASSTAVGLPKGRSKIYPRANNPEAGLVSPAAAIVGTMPEQQQQKKKKQRLTGVSADNKRKGSKNKRAPSSSKKNKSKTVHALVLSPEIQAALARGDSLGDSDSDDDATDKKPPKIVSRPAGSDPKDLLSLLPKPSTAASADSILLLNQRKRQQAKSAKSKTDPGTEAAAAARTAASTAVRAATPERKSGSGGDATSRASAKAGSGNDPDRADQSGGEEESDSDDDGDDLLAGMRASSAASPAAGARAASDPAPRKSPLFTLPSRARPPPIAVAAGVPLAEGERGLKGVLTPVGDGTAGEGEHLEGGTQDHRKGGQQQWGAAAEAHPVAEGMVAGGGVPGYATCGVPSGQQQQRSPYSYSGMAQPAASFGGAGHQGSGSHTAVYDDAGSKATRRKGRDMERALARGNLGALGNEVSKIVESVSTALTILQQGGTMPVMDLHQGSNEYNPLLSKPVTAAMKQEQKHIESSVYDPRTGKTVKTLEPTSTQKRKHQINQLAVQAASMERDLMERSGASRLTKAQTHAKYGW